MHIYGTYIVTCTNVVAKFNSPLRIQVYTRLTKSLTMYQDLFNMDESYHARKMSVSTSTAINMANTIQYIIHFVCSKANTHLDDDSAVCEEIMRCTHIVSVAFSSHCFEGGIGWVDNARQNSVPGIRKTEK